VSEGAYEVAGESGAAPAATAMVTESVNCVRCGYDLHGLARSGRCPECRMLVERSLLGDNLVYSAPEYVRKLQLGLSLILNAIVVFLVAFIVGVIGLGLGIYLTGGLLGVVGIGATIGVLAGWWLFSEDDPAYIGTNRGSTARVIVRGSTAVALAFTIGNVTFSLMPVRSGLSMMFAPLAGFASLIVWTVQFLGAMFYLRWLSARLPSEYVRRRATTLMWLCPVLVMGPILFVFIARVGGVLGLLMIVGVAASLVLYWNLLNRIRGEIRTIRARQAILAD
jgi:hypothetical protein